MLACGHRKTESGRSSARRPKPTSNDRWRLKLGEQACTEPTDHEGRGQSCAPRRSSAEGRLGLTAVSSSHVVRSPAVETQKEVTMAFHDVTLPGTRPSLSNACRHGRPPAASAAEARSRPPVTWRRRVLAASRPVRLTGRIICSVAAPQRAARARVHAAPPKDRDEQSHRRRPACGHGLLRWGIHAPRTEEPDGAVPVGEHPQTPGARGRRGTDPAKRAGRRLEPPFPSPTHVDMAATDGRPRRETKCPSP